MSASNRTAEVLLKAKLIDELQLRSALARQSQWGGRLGKHVVELGFAAEAAIVEAVVKATGLPRMELGLAPRDGGALAKVDVAFAEERGVYPLALRDNGKTLWLAMADPNDLETVDVIAARTGCRVRAGVAGEREILTAISRHYKGQEPVFNASRAERNLDAEPSGEFSLTDIHGNSLAVPAAAPGRPTPAPVAAAPENPQRVSTPARPVAAPTPAPRPQPELPPEVAAALPPAASEHLRRMQAELEKTTRVLRGLIELCLEKQVFNNDEMRAAVAKLAR